MLFGIGRHRDTPEPNDPRYRRGAAPQAANIPGLPQSRREQIDYELFVEDLKRQPLNVVQERLIRRTNLPVTPEIAAKAVQYLDLPGQAPISLVEAVELASIPGDPRQMRGEARRKSAQIAQKVGEASEIGPDIGVLVAEELHKRGKIDLNDPNRSIESQIRTLKREDVKDAVIRAQRGEKFRQLSVEETERAAERQGLGKTIKGKRNPLRKNRGDSDIAFLTRAPGNVISQGLEISERDMYIPVLVAPRNQEDRRTGEMQVAQYFVGKDDRGRARFAPSLRDARVLYINPYAEVPDRIVGELGLDLITVAPGKEVAGGYDVSTLGAPIPDVTQDRSQGLPPREDPSYAGDAGLRRNPTIAEALQQLDYRNTTRILSVPVSALQNGGQGAIDRVGIGDNVVDVYALGNKRSIQRDPAGRELSNDPAPIIDYVRQPSTRDEYGDVIRGDVEPVVDVRVPGEPIPGSGMPKRNTPAYFREVDDFIDSLASVEFGRESVATEIPDAARLGANPYASKASATRPGETRYSALVNLRNVDPVASQYQRQLLEEAGFPASARFGKQGNPLMGLLDSIKAIAAAPTDAAEVPLTRPTLSAAEAEKIVAPKGRTGVARLLQEAKRPIVGPKGQKPTTEGFDRITVEKEGRRQLAQLLSNPERAQRPREETPRGPATKWLAPKAVQPPVPGLERQASATSTFPQPVPQDPATQALESYMARKAQAEQQRPKPTRWDNEVQREMLDETGRAIAADEMAKSLPPVGATANSGYNMTNSPTAPARQPGIPGLEVPYTLASQDEKDPVKNYWRRQAIARDQASQSRAGTFGYQAPDQQLDLRLKGLRRHRPLHP